MMQDFNIGVSLLSPPPMLSSATPSASMFDTWTTKIYNKKTRKVEPINCN